MESVCFAGVELLFCLSCPFFTFLGHEPLAAAAGSQGIYSPARMQSTWLPVTSSYPPHLQCFMFLAIN